MHCRRSSSGAAKRNQYPHFLLNFFSISEPVEDWQLFENNFANEISINTEQLLELKPGYTFSEELFNGDDFVVELKEEHWNDTKLGASPQLLDYSIDTDIPNPSPVTKVQNPVEINTCISATFDTTTLTQLTPPQSPPHTFTAVLNDAQNVNQTAVGGHQNISVTIANGSSKNFEPYIWNGNNTAAVASEEIERETQIVDEIVNRRAQELMDWNDDSQSMFSSSGNSSMLSITDEECQPNSPSGASSSQSSSPVHIANTEFEKMQAISSNSLPIKRTRPYGRGVEDRKIRKKEQNKNAATRYRQKKKQEMEIVLSEEQELSNRNVELKRILVDRNREAKYLKTLIREFYKKN